jgi:hypothetical protein
MAAFPGKRLLLECWLQGEPRFQNLPAWKRTLDNA